ncbi:hypothetical protein B0F87_11336 [Methylobacter tundripaludum]|uniref:DUF6603 domain-containing protein n=1 Tax=Methylobacter tundripaludum TaxID=173365 RepID=A0A2S6H8Y4_9GAMM|nr:DUF6603 domain-containing protein [Methylobacter tundripaludum]PPK73925.1 hypothetical protein B0F87_11336 [Methylobacter tundripaludum]
MADDVWTALVKGALGFAHSRAGDLTGTSFKDTGSLVSSLFDNSPAGSTKERLKKLKEDIDALSKDIEVIVKAIDLQINAAKTAVQNMAKELGTDPFNFEAAGRAATELGYVLIAFDTALDIVADKLAEEEPPGPNHDANAMAIKTAIKGIDEPWKAPFRNLAADATKAFDALCKSVLGTDNASKEFATRILWSRTDKRIGILLQSAGARNIGALGFDGASVEAFFSYLTDAKLGITVKAKLKAGLRSDKLLEKIIPGEKATADTNQTAINLDTKDGLTFGEGKDHKLVLPVRFSFPGVELREFAITRPDSKDKDNGRIDLITTVAGKIGDQLGVVVEGSGVTITWVGGDGAIDVQPKPPYAAGLRVSIAGVVSGGGFLRYKEDVKEYGGTLDLQLTKIGITAIGLIGTEPFSFVVVIGVHFLPKIELSFGFTLNGLGGILAIERTMDLDALSKGLKDGAVGQLLFPENPVDAAPQILDRLANIFPPRSGGFVVGPIAELGWGSQAGFLKARLGIVLALPDPKLVIVGALQIGVPSADAPPKLRVVDIHAELLGEITPDFFFLKVSLAPSKLAGLTISGDMGILIRWAGGSAFAVSIGGFFPKYTPPPQLTDMRRVAVDLAPPVDWITVHVEAYVAVTSNTIQFGGKVDVNAKLGPVSAHAWIGLDALFQWSPRYYFIFIVDAGIEIKAFGATLAGVSFHGELSGMHPWHLEGTASVEILFWTVHADIGPLEWGELDKSVAELVNPLQVAQQALTENTAWTLIPPVGTETLARFNENTIPLLVHPLGSLEVKQLKVPFETDIDRIGSNPVSTRRINLSAPKVGELDSQAVSHSTDHFPPGHFIKMNDDEQATRPDFEEFPCGMKIVTTTTPKSGDTTSATYQWNTVYPHQSFESHLLEWNLLSVASMAMRTNAVSVSQRQRGNPYLADVPRGTEEPIEIRDTGIISVRFKDNLKSVAGLEDMMTTTAAIQSIATRSQAEKQQFEFISVGVAA